MNKSYHWAICLTFAKEDGTRGYFQTDDDGVFQTDEDAKSAFRENIRYYIKVYKAPILEAAWLDKCEEIDNLDKIYEGK